MLSDLNYRAGAKMDSKDMAWGVTAEGDAARAGSLGHDDGDPSNEAFEGALPRAFWGGEGRGCGSFMWAAHGLG
jgi:hypothetical protein